MSIILSILALVLLCVVHIVYSIFIMLNKVRKVKWYKKVDSKNYILALNIDIFGNYLYRDLWNWLFNPKHRFGTLGETMSSVFGKNILYGKMNVIGWCIALSIDFIDISKWRSGFKGTGFHCVSAIQDIFEIEEKLK